MNKPLNGSLGNKRQKTLSSFLFALLMLGGCATTNEITDQQNLAEKSDPYEKFNRKMYSFNDGIDNYVAKPVSDAYKSATPQLLQTGISNFFSNLKNFNTVLNDILQAKFEQSAKDAGRLAINSTIGLGGLVDVAGDVGLKQGDEDFEQTLAVWGIPAGSYLVLPLLGPTTTRGIPGTIVDTVTNPITYVGAPVRIISNYVGAPVQMVSLLNTRANAEGSLQFINEAALDKYVFTRESFLQWRNSLAKDGKTGSISNFDDELDETPADTSRQTPSNTAPVNKTVQNASMGTHTKRLELLPVTPQSMDNTARSVNKSEDKQIPYKN